MLNKKDKIEQFKRDLRSRTFYTKMVVDCFERLEEISVHIGEVGAIRNDVVRLENNHSPQNHLLYWMMEEEKIIKEKDHYELLIQEIDDKLNCLEDQSEKIMLIDLYVKNKNHEKVADANHINRQNMYKKIDKILSTIL